MLQNGWLAELTANVLEWSASRFAEELAPGRPSRLLKATVLENSVLSEALIDDRVAKFLYQTVTELGLNSCHILAIMAFASGNNRSPNTRTQDRLVSQWTSTSSDAHVRRPYKLFIGMFFVRDKGAAQSNEVDAKSCSVKDSFLDESLLLSNNARIFRICVALGPPRQPEQWCDRCHLLNTRHHHCPRHGVGELGCVDSLSNFINRGKERKPAVIRSDDPKPGDSILPEVRSFEII